MGPVGMFPLTLTALNRDKNRYVLPIKDCLKPDFQGTLEIPVKWGMTSADVQLSPVVAKDLIIPPLQS